MTNEEERKVRRYCEIIAKAIETYPQTHKVACNEARCQSTELVRCREARRLWAKYVNEEKIKDIKLDDHKLFTKNIRRLKIFPCEDPNYFFIGGKTPRVNATRNIEGSFTVVLSSITNEQIHAFMVLLNTGALTKPIKVLSPTLDNVQYVTEQDKKFVNVEVKLTINKQLIIF